MEKSLAVVALFVSAFCFSSALARNSPLDKFAVEGKIYCDPCHFAFESRLSFPLPGVKVSLICVNDGNGTVTYLKEGKTDANGMYSIRVHGDHEEEICVMAADPPAEGECREAMPNRSDRIVLTKNMGASSMTRFVNPLGFMTQTIDTQCNSVVKELQLDQLED
ncbi:pollen-specific protein-like At4g18596 [Cajanus cajan]|uniref:Olee1-like protein n=1 Tax=Cajanus cajan TaxID=3821 RepID=A0A151S9A2_CAJCA|nr:pollen-specific protein-like At4g18596 [Cajanus cajan]KYP51372.1 Olee1-like protein [Cajanus cajan]